MARSTRDILARFSGKAPTGPASIHEFQVASGLILPEDYAQFLQEVNGGEGFIGPQAYLILWPLEELQGLNEAYEVQEYAPGLFLFGSNGGGEAFAFDTRVAGNPIVTVPFVGMDRELARPMAPTFEEFLLVLANS